MKTTKAPKLHVVVEESTTVYDPSAPYWGDLCLFFFSINFWSQPRLQIIP